MNKSEFDVFLEKIEHLQKGSRVRVAGVYREAIFMASYFAEHYPDDWYIKLFFKDGSILEVMPNSKEVFFCRDGRSEVNRGLLDDSGKCLIIEDEKYTALDLDDTQIVKKVYFGDVSDGEGGCVFSDYGSGDRVWSLATLDDGTISDVCAEKIAIEDVFIDN